MMALERDFYNLVHNPRGGVVRSLHAKYGSNFVDLLMDEWISDKKRYDNMLIEYVTIVGYKSLKTGSDLERQVWLLIKRAPSVQDVIDILTSYPDGFNLHHIIEDVIVNGSVFHMCCILDKLLDAKYYVLFNEIIEHHCKCRVDFRDADIILEILRKCPYTDIKWVLKLIPNYTTEAMIEEDMENGGLTRAIVVRLFEKTKKQRKTTLMKLKHRNPQAYKYVKKIYYSNVCDQV